MRIVTDYFVKKKDSLMESTFTPTNVSVEEKNIFLNFWLFLIGFWHVFPKIQFKIQNYFVPKSKSFFSRNSKKIFLGWSDCSGIGCRDLAPLQPLWRQLKRSSCAIIGFATMVIMQYIINFPRIAFSTFVSNVVCLLYQMRQLHTFLCSCSKMFI